MEFITDASEVDQSKRRYYYRMRYPSKYKCDKTKIIKFDRDHKKELEYTFIGLFPKNLSSIPVSYGTSDILKVNVAFEYERYIAGKSTSKSVADGTSGNKGALDDFDLEPFTSESTGSQSTLAQLADQGAFGPQ